MYKIDDVLDVLGRVTRRMAYRFDGVEANELISEVCIKLKDKEFETKGMWGVVAKRRMIDYLRKMYGRKFNENRPKFVGLEDSDGAEGDIIADIVRRDILELLEGMLAEDNKKFLHEYFIDGKKLKDIGKARGISEAGASKQKTKAIAECRDILGLENKYVALKHRDCVVYKKGR